MASAYYGAAEVADNSCTPAVDPANQAGALRSSTGADPAGPAGPVVYEYRYDGAGRPVASKVVGDANWSCTSYDERGRVTSTSDSAAVTTTLGYSLDGSLTTTGADSAGAVRTTVAAVDWLGRAGSYTDETATTTSTSYDPYGRPSQRRRRFAGGAEALLAEMGYDGASRVNSMVDYSGGTARTHRFSYAGDGALVTTARANGTVTTNGYDPARGWLVTSSTTSALGGQLSPWSYTTTAAGRVATEATTGRTRSFAYDGAGRLQTTTEGATTRRYGYDANSNRCSTTTATGCDGAWSYDSADRLVSSPFASSYSYDAHGNVTSAVPTAAAGVAGQTISYDGADHATTISDGTTTNTETLGPTGRVLRRRVTILGGLVTTEDTTFAYDGPGDSPAYSWATPILGLPPLSRTTYLNGPSGLLVIDSGLAGLATYPVTNGHGDIVGTTDLLGLFTANPVADEFGRGEPPANRLGWLGNYQRRSTGAALHLVRMGVRLYDPNLGRFLQVDPVEGGSCNDYDYVCGDPVNQFDLGGTHCKKTKTVTDDETGQRRTVSHNGHWNSFGCKGARAAVAVGRGAVGAGHLVVRAGVLVTNATCAVASVLSVASVPGSLGFVGSQAGSSFLRRAWSGGKFRGPAATFSRASGWVTAGGTAVDVACRVAGIG